MGFAAATRGLGERNRILHDRIGDMHPARGFAQPVDILNRDDVAGSFVGSMASDPRLISSPSMRCSSSALG